MYSTESRDLKEGPSLKRLISVVLQTILFLAVFGIGSFLPAFNLLPMWKMGAGATHDFVLDGLVFMILLYLIILGIEALQKRVRNSGALSTIAFVLALVLGFVMKFGMVSVGSAAS
jgi:hypothetical protein